MLGRLLVDDTEVVVMRNGLRFTKQASFQVMEVKCDSLRLVQNLRADISTAPIAIILFHTVALLYDGDGKMKHGDNINWLDGKGRKALHNPHTYEYASQWSPNGYQ
ncbi:hypothetical protein Fot_05741 [Forsythia ovata]|uniref:Uncharacterized protein n=1 Tax=Forsythia ovata TaxID=205694 RepID=A0ABD1WRD3_9LAMI